MRNPGTYVIMPDAEGPHGGMRWVVAKATWNDMKRFQAYGDALWCISQASYRTLREAVASIGNANHWRATVHRYSGKDSAWFVRTNG